MNHKIVSLVFLLQFTFSRGGQNSPVVGALYEDGWVSLFNGEDLTGWESTRFGGEGIVEIRQDAIVLEMSEMLTGITWQRFFPRVNYEIVLEARRVSGNDFFCGLTFPVEDEYCSLIVGGWGGSLVGLSSIDGLDASENETTSVMTFESNRWYEIRVSVEADRIQAWIDEEQVVDVDTAGAELSVRPETRLSRPLGIASWRTTAAIRAIRYRQME